MNCQMKKVVYGIIVVALFLSMVNNAVFAAENKEPTQRQKMIFLVNVSSFMKNVATALEMYKTDHKSYPASADKIFGDYLRDNRENRGKLSGFNYAASKKGKSFELAFKLNQIFKDAKMNIPKGYPRYKSKVGKVEYQPGVFDIGKVKF